MPKQLDVQPGDGLGTILPGETIQRQASYLMLLAPFLASRRALVVWCVMVWRAACGGKV